MINIRPFRGLRPKEGLEDKMACKPYDVINHEEALELGGIIPTPLSMLPGS